MKKLKGAEGAAMATPSSAARSSAAPSWTVAWRLAGAALVALAAALPAAAAQCTAHGYAVSDGGGACLPALRDGAVAQVLHRCEGGRWEPTDAACPADFAHFCRIGPHAVPVGTRLLLGSGPQSIECRAPGTLHLVALAPGGAAPPAEAPPETAAAPPAPSALVRRLQRHVAEATGAPALCPGGACSGIADAATRAAIAAFVADNLQVLTAEERARLGLGLAADPDAALAALNPLDLYPMIAEIFDVAPAD